MIHSLTSLLVNEVSARGKKWLRRGREPHARAAAAARARARARALALDLGEGLGWMGLFCTNSG